MSGDPADAPLRPLATILQAIGIAAAGWAALRYLERRSPGVVGEAERVARERWEAEAERLRRLRDG